MIFRVIILLLLPFCAFSQQALPGQNESIPSINSTPVPTFWMQTPDQQVSVQQILADSGSTSWKTLQPGTPLAPGFYYWYLLDFERVSLDAHPDWVLRFGVFDEITLFTKAGKEIQAITGGLLCGAPVGSLAQTGRFTIQPSQLFDGRFLVAQIRYHYWIRKMIQPDIRSPLSQKFQQEYLSLRELKEFIPGYLLMGGMLLMIFYTLGIYLINRDHSFLHYMAYQALLFAYLFIRMPPWGYWLEISFPVAFYFGNETLQVLVNIAYLVFVSVFLETKKQYPAYHHTIRIAVIFLVIVLALQLILLSNQHLAWLEQYLIQLERITMILYSLGSYGYLLKHYKNKMALFIVAGSLCFLAGGIMSMILGDIKYIMTGALLEIFVFSLALGYRIKVIQALEEKFESDMNKIRLKALRAQMNPHFIFNSLNSVRAYIIANEPKMASDYLKKFARLIRLMLQYSNQDFIALQEEIDALHLYVELEQMRFQTNFGFSIIMDPEINPKKYQVPPMILQPFVENAIIHGLAPLKDAKKLTIYCILSSDFLEIRVCDNGIGRVVSEQRNRLRTNLHQSMATELTKKRIAILTESQDYLEHIQIIDLMNQQKPAGTEVHLKLPLLPA